MAGTRVAGLVLAAGAGRRYGMPKALVAYQGQLLVERAAGALRGGGCAPVAVVLGAAADRVRREAALGGVTVVENPDWDSGMGSSLRAGLAALAGPAGDGAVAVVVVLVDMPGVGAGAVRRVADRAGPGALVTAGYGDRRGHPVLLGRDHWPGVAAAARGDAGARGYLRRHTAIVQVVPCGDIADDRDLDTPGQDPTGRPADPPNLLPGSS